MPQPNLSITPTTVAGKDGFFKITLPAGWATVTPPNPSYQLAARNPDAETYLVVSSVKTADIADWQAFTETLKGKLIGNLTQSTSSETVKIRVNGFDALRADIAGTLKNGARVHYLSTVVKTDQNLVYLLSWSLESKFASNRSEFETSRTSVAAEDRSSGAAMACTLGEKRLAKLINSLNASSSAARSRLRIVMPANDSACTRLISIVTPSCRAASFSPKTYSRGGAPARISSGSRHEP